GYADFEATLKAFNPVNNLRHIGAGSTFIVGRFDTVVPYRSAMNVATEAKANNPTARNLVLPLGHSSTLFTGVQLLRFNLWNRKCRAARSFPGKRLPGELVSNTQGAAPAATGAPSTQAPESGGV